MVKDQDYLEKKASYCLDLAKKLGATDTRVNVGNSISCLLYTSDAADE